MDGHSGHIFMWRYVQMKAIEKSMHHKIVRVTAKKIVMGWLQLSMPLHFTDNRYNCGDTLWLQEIAHKMTLKRTWKRILF